jgi:predicted permease
MGYERLPHRPGFHHAHVSLRWVEEGGRNMRQGLRILRQSPTHAVAAVLTLALCIGANTAIFSVVDGFLLRPLPYPRPGQLAEVVTVFRGGADGQIDRSHDALALRVLREYAWTLDCAAFSGEFVGANLVAAGRPEYVQQQRVSDGFFRVLGIRPLHGREFTPEEDRLRGPAVVILGYDLWRRDFGGDPGVVGRTILLGGEPQTVVGIVPSSSQTGFRADLWTPLRPSEGGEGGSGSGFGVVARLHPGVSWGQAGAQVEALAPTALADLKLPPGASSLRLIPLQRGLILELRQPVLMLWGAVAVVLLIGCLNIAGLLLASTGRRTREIATRMALGGRRVDIVRQMLSESLLLAAFGGIGGIGLGYLGLEGLRRLAGASSLDVLQGGQIRLDLRVLGATACLSLLTSVAFGLLPALRAGATDLRSALAAAGGHRAARRWPHRTLAVAEVALGVVLLVAAGLLIRSYSHLRHLSPGFDESGVVAARLSLQDARYGSSLRMNRLFEASLARIHEVPGVRSAAVSLGLPYERLMQVVTWPDGPGRREPGSTCLAYVTPEYFSTLRIPLLQGRAFGDADRRDSAPIVVVNRAFARKYLTASAAVGSHIKLLGVRREVVGLVGDVQQKIGWSPYAPLRPMPAAFIPATQVTDEFAQLAHAWVSPAWVVRSSGSRQALFAGIRGAVEATDPLLPFIGFRTMEEIRSSSLGGTRFQAVLLTVLGGLALVLAGVGICGLTAQAVTERTRELGIRMALGATIAAATGSVALPGISLAVAGIALGVLLARLAVQLMVHMVFGVSPGDPVTFIVVSGVLFLVAVCASLLPALRAARIDPADTLRSE